MQITEENITLAYDQKKEELFKTYLELLEHAHADKERDKASEQYKKSMMTLRKKYDQQLNTLLSSQKKHITVNTKNPFTTKTKNKNNEQ